MDEVSFGRYRLFEVIGRGGMGEVFKAHDTMMRRDVAIKVLPAELADQPGYRQRFEREAFTAARLTEPHVIPIFESGEIDGRLYLSMPIIEGIDLAKRLSLHGPTNPQLAVKIIEQLASALDAAHAAELVHRDVKPSNALVTGRDFVYLIDFGIAHDTTATKITQTGSVMGTLAYMAPERFETGIAEPSADIYALAAVLFECLTGEQPFPGSSLAQQLHAHCYQEPPRPSSRIPGLSNRFDAVIARGMAKNPRERYGTALELAEAAQHALDATVTTQTLSHPTLEAVPATEINAAGIRAFEHQPTQVAPVNPPPKPAPVLRPGSDPAQPRPPAVTAAVVIAFVTAALIAATGVSYAIAATDAVGAQMYWYDAVALVHLLGSAVMVCGALALALRRARQILLVAAWALALVEASLSANFGFHLPFGALTGWLVVGLLVAAAVALTVLVRMRSSRDFFTAAKSDAARPSARTAIGVAISVYLVIIAITAAVLVNNQNRESRESRLFAELPGSVNRADCTGNTAGFKQLAEVKCTDRSNTPAVSAFYALYASRSDLSGEFNDLVGQHDGAIFSSRLAPCPGRAQSPTTWAGGSVACFADAAGASDMDHSGVVWTRDAGLIMGWAFGSGSIQWWQSHFG